MNTKLISLFTLLVMAVVVGIVVLIDSPAEDPTTSVIVQAADLETAAEAVRSAGGEITHELGVIRAVGAVLTKSQVEGLQEVPGVRIHENRSVKVAGKPGSVVDTVIPRAVVADELHWEGITGAGVTVAVLDTGVWDYPPFTKDTSSVDRLLAQYDAIGDLLVSEGDPLTTDTYGHGSHVASIVVSNIDVGKKTPVYNGVAPDAGLVTVKAFDDNGMGTYADVIRGIDWVVRNKDAYGIRVLNCSFSATPQSHYWVDPMNQAVMAAWQAGIVVVASAGNTGPEPMTIGVPGNVPYVITVGAITDNYTPYDEGDDSLASFSAAGPTVEGFVKPDVVAPGGHVYGLMAKDMALPVAYPEFFDEGQYFQMSGTSQAAAVVSGVVALMLQIDPGLTPDDVKCRLMSTARPRADGGSVNGKAS